MILSTGAVVTAQQAVTVEIREFALWPRDTVITAGTPVQWMNFDDAPHQIVLTGGRPGSSSLIEPGKDYVFAFKEPGRVHVPLRRPSDDAGCPRGTDTVAHPRKFAGANSRRPPTVLRTLLE